MSHSAKLLPSQPGLTASLEADVPSGQVFSTHWPETSAKLQLLTKEVAIALAAKVACLYLLDQNRERLVPYFFWSTLISSPNFTEQAIDDSLVGWAVQSRRLVRADNLSGDHRSQLTGLDFSHNSALAMPLIVAQDQPAVGVLLLVDKVDQPAFLAQDEQMLESLVDRSVVALAMRNATIARKKPDWNQRLTILNQISQTLNTALHSMDVDRVCRTILLLPGLKDIFQFDIAEICLWDARAKTLTTALRQPNDALDIQVLERTYHPHEGYTGWIATHQQALLISDTWHYSDAVPKVGLSNFPYHSFIGAPLKLGAKFLGTLELVAGPINFYESADLAMLEVIANQAAIAIDHARLFQEAQSNLSKLSLLFDASRELASTLSYEELLNDLAVGLTETFAADECAIYSFDEAAGALTLIHQYTKSLSGQVKAVGEKQNEAETITASALLPDTIPLNIAKFPALQAALKKQTPLTVRSNGSEAGSHELEWLRQKNYGMMVAVPLISRDRVTGLVQLFSTDPQAFAEDDIWLAQSLVTQANIALENAHLFSLTDQQLQERVNELAGLQRVSSELNSTLDLNRVLTIVLEEAIRVTQADFGNVNLYDAKTGKLAAHKEQGWLGRTQAKRAKSKRSSRTTSATGGIMERALRTSKAVLVPNVLLDKDYVHLGDGEARSEVVVPIFYSGEPAGVINLESKRLNFFNDDQLRYLEALANQAAVAIGNTQAYQEQKRQRERANRRADQLARLSEISNAFRTSRPLPEILEDIAYAISESVGFNVVLISLSEGQPPAIHHQVGANIPVTQLEMLRSSVQPQPLANLQAVMQEEFRLSKSYFIPVERAATWQGKLDVPEIERSSLSQPSLTEAERLALGLPPEKENPWQLGDVLFVPLTNIDDQIIGLLTVEDPENGERPDILVAQTLEIFANHAAAAIENARLFELEQQRRRLADTLRDVAGAISSQLDFDELLNVVLQELAKVVHYDSASVQLLKEDQLVVTGGRGWPDKQQVIGHSFSMGGDNPSRMVVETQEPLLVGDVQLAYPAAFANPPYHQIRSWLGVPLTYGTNVIGLMAVYSTQVDMFTQEDANVLFLFANQVAVAWQNAHLFEEARQQVRQLAALTEVAQSLNRALDLTEILNLVLDAVFDLVGQSQGSIWLIDEITRTVRIAETKNVPSFLIELFNESAISVDSEPFAAVIKSGQELVIKGSRTRDDIANYGLPFPDDVTYVPLKTEVGVIGILAIETVIRDKNMLKLVTTLADLAAVAIEGARLLEDTRQRANEMQYLYRLGVEVSGVLDVREVMSSVIRDVLTLSQTQIGAIVSWNEESKSYIVEGALNTAESVAHLILNEAKELLAVNAMEEGMGSLWSDLTKQIMLTGLPLIINPTAPASDYSTSPPTENEDKQSAKKRALPLGVRALLGVPIQVQNQTSGAIFVCTLALRNFNDHDVQLLSFVANQTAVAIRNAQLVHRLSLFTEELERRVVLRTEELANTLDELTEERDRVESLYQITRELSASFDLDRVLVEALSLINRAVGISQGSILLFDPETGRLIYRSALGRDRALPRGGLLTAYRPGYGLAGKVIESRQPRLVPDLLEEPDWVIRKDTPDRRSALVVPLITGEDVLGVLLLFHPDPDYFTEDHLKLVNAAGVQIGTAINNAELYRLITDQAQRLGVMLRTQAAEAAKNQAILRGITDGVLVLDAKRSIVLVNPKAAEILNVDASALENQSIHDCLGQSQTTTLPELSHLFYQNLLKALTLIESGERSAEFRIEAGKKAVAVSLAPVALGADYVPSVIAVLRDISREAEIERLKNEFISTVSHELRTPMTSIKGYADLLVSGSSQIGALNPVQYRFVQIIQSNANRLTELVNDILEISRIETGRVKLEFEALDIIQLIEEVAVSFEGQMVKKAINLSLNLPDHLSHVYADKARVMQILVNLIGNAWQYTPEGGSITVRAQVANENFVQIDVEDNGIGIVEQDVDYIFDRFFRSERTEVQVVDGTGLGLSITKWFVEMLGGKIWVKSQVDIGSTFSFTLPINVASRPVQPLELPGGEVSSLSELAHLLIIDDNPDVVSLLQPRLEEAGYEIMVAAAGEQVMSMVHQAGGVLRLIMLSLLLKNADSFLLLEQLKRDPAIANVPVLLSSLSSTGKGQELSLEIVDYLATSFEEAQVLDSVQLALNPSGNAPLVEAIGAPLSKKSVLDRILVVGDNRDSINWLKNTLDAGGYRVQRAFNSQQALDIAAGNKPDLILIDPTMHPVNGETIIAQLRHILDPANVPIIAVTDRAIPPKVDSTVKLLGKEYGARLKRPCPVEAVVAEIIQLGGKTLPGARHG